MRFMEQKAFVNGGILINASSSTSLLSITCTERSRSIN